MKPIEAFGQFVEQLAASLDDEDREILREAFAVLLRLSGSLKLDEPALREFVETWHDLPPGDQHAAAEKIRDLAATLGIDLELTPADSFESAPRSALVY